MLSSTIAAVLLSAVVQSPATAAPTVAPPQGVECVDRSATRAWADAALSAWSLASGEILRLQRPISPDILLFDSSCAWRLTPSDEETYRASGAAHGGSIEAPDGARLPVGVTAFAAPGTERPFFVMAAPEIFRRAVADSPDPDALLLAVFVHEITHTQQIPSLGRRIDALVARGLPEDVDDDVVQRRFGERPGYRAAYERERDLLFAAAAARDLATARRLAGQAAAAMQQRRVRWLSGDETIYAEAEDAFLVFEGAANWTAYAWLIHPNGGAKSPQDALPLLRRSGRFWSQDEGLALFLVLDRLLPDWRERAFAANPPGALTMLQAAAAE